MDCADEAKDLNKRATDEDAKDLNQRATDELQTAVEKLQKWNDMMEDKLQPRLIQYCNQRGINAPKNLNIEGWIKLFRAHGIL